MIQSSVWQAAQAEGTLAAFREFCREQVRKHHPALLERAGPLIDTCGDLDRLKAWALGATDFDA